MPHSHENTPSCALMPHGRMMRTGAGWQWEYHLRDHLGNTRLTIADTAGRGVAVVLQNTHYYPFGMSIATLSHTTAGHANPWLYNGKEHQPDFDLGWYDYGARFYDAEVGRFTGVDPLAQEYRFQSPYAYAANNPIRFIDWNGEGPTDWYQSEDGQLLWKSGSEKSVTFNGKEYRHYKKDGAKLGSGGATLIISSIESSDIGGDVESQFEGSVEGTAREMGKEGMAVIAKLDTREDFVEAFEQTTTSFGSVNGAVVRTHGDSDLGLAIGDRSLGAKGIDALASAIADGTVKFNKGSSILLLGCGLGALSEKGPSIAERFASKTGITTIGAQGTVGNSSWKGDFHATMGFVGVSGSPLARMAIAGAGGYHISYGKNINAKLVRGR